MKTTKLFISTGLKTRLLFVLATLAAYSQMALIYAQQQLKWSQAANENSPVNAWIRNIILVIMGIFIMVSLILGALAFKQLSADGNWKDFWSKIAGAVGMFVTPIVIYWLIDKN